MTLLQGSSYIWPAARNLQPAARSPQNSQFANIKGKCNRYVYYYILKKKTIFFSFFFLFLKKK